MTVSDANGCAVNSDAITINVNESPTIAESADETICSGTSTVISASASGGTEPYTFTWDNGLGEGASHTVSPLTTTTYNVTIEDANGCVDFEDVVITVNESPTVIASADATTICSGTSAELTATGSGGTPPYTYTWDNGSGHRQLSQTVSPIVTTTYSVTVSDANGCAVNSDAITINVNESPVITASADETICSGTSTVISATVSGGNGPYTYTWDNGLGTGASQTVSPIVTTTYNVTVEDANGCVDSGQVVISVNESPTVVASADETICSGESVLISATPGGGNGPYTFSWDNGLGVRCEPYR